MSALDLLGEVIAQGAKVSSATLRLKPDYSPLVEYGHLRETGVVSSIACLDCYRPHDAEVIFETGQYGYFCPDLGFVPVARADVQGVVADLRKLIERLADVFDCKRRKATPLHGQTWRIGALETDHGDVMLYFHPRLRSENDARDLADALAREVRSTWRLIVTADGALPIQGAETVPLRDLVELDPQDGRLTATANPRLLVGVPPKRASGAPNRFGILLRDLIQIRKQSGQALPGRNEEAKALLTLIQRENPGTKPPSLSSIRSYVTKAQGG